MALRVQVCRVGDVAPGESRGFIVPGVDMPIMITNLDGTLIATSSICPHEDVSLLGCKRRGAIIVCRGHGYRFDLRTGACSHDPRLFLPRYRVSIEGDLVYVELV
jgi:nitrite reductase/ring-hydroxylating ferredoxin subunit